MNLTPGELLQLKKLRGAVARASVVVQLHEIGLQDYILVLEEKYQIVDKIASIDINTGEISVTEKPKEPEKTEG